MYLDEIDFRENTFFCEDQFLQMVDITKNLLGFTFVICKYALLRTGVLRVNIKDAVKCNVLFFSLTLLHKLTFS